ncbi:MAG: ABC transporter ATP-binding protein, partial [Clostridia bacterium]|nr:ABC transporter ATP-binding protein [Clostridia bacterium]
MLNDNDTDLLLGALKQVESDKGNKDAKVQRIATVLDISYDGAKRLWDLYSAGGDKTQWLASVDSAEQEQKAKNAQNGISVNDEFHLVDENGVELVQQRKYTDYEIKQKVYQTAEKLDLTPYLDKLPRELSGGQMQRVALGRAIIKNVPVFLMDEPLSNLDAKLRLTMRSEIVKLHNNIGATTIYVTHDQTEAMTMATRIVVMSRGFIQQIASPEEVYNSPANLFVAKFIGSPSMNIF